MTIAYDAAAPLGDSARVAATSASPLARKIAESAIAVAAAVGMTATISVGPASAATEHRRFERSELRGPVERPTPAERGVPAGRSDQETINWIKDRSGLTWEQLAQAFSVSRRAVHMWQSGSRVSAANAEALHWFADLVRSNLRDTAELTRSALLDVGPSGVSAVDMFRTGRERRPRERALAEIEVGQQAAGHTPTAEDMRRAARVLDGELTPEEARVELMKKYRK
ncbi:antitoxin VbhA family protein [Nocardioides panzhihuensis]|uniref:Transcriptional regulator with XRE-family HTH domain n=1 Tax=Nocardioides panzhihuensis TaxID=860243 RepID=A0A7Z0IV37_9ACTN|nr:antitoxin VbhA family protein [Nocardioides panzhihuensis]NYI80630.1 transcriptional regulator with XRE-family HTH domain [Nocardioides panzhihuensis]